MQAQSGTFDATTGLMKTGLRSGLPRKYSSTLGAFPQIMREDGIRAGLWRGSSATIIRAAGLSGSQLASYVGAPRGPLHGGCCRSFLY